MKERSYVPSEVALLASLVLHALAILGWEQRAVLARWPGFHTLAKAFVVPAVTVRKPVEPLVPVITFVEVPEPPRMFVETDASQVTGEQPKDAKFYSDNATVAANPENPTGKVGDTPYLKGKDTRMLSTESVVPGPPSLPAPVPMVKPAAPPEPPKPVPEPPKNLAEAGVKVVEETKVAPVETPVPVAPPAPPVSPSAGSHREIAAIKSRMMAIGAGRIGIAAFNVEASPFGAYDKAVIRAVQSRWYALIEQNGLYERAGTVTLHFNLLPDGSVRDMNVKENSAGQILGLFCEKAVVDSAPFDPLPENLRVLIGSDPREVNFTFYY